MCYDSICVEGGHVCCRKCLMGGHVLVECMSSGWHILQYVFVLLEEISYWRACFN